MQTEWAEFKNELGDRTKYIGGSDIASIMGVSPYKTAYQLWLEKTGQVTPEDISNKPHVRRGIEAEPVARDLINRKLGRKFSPLRIEGPSPWMIANVDGIDNQGLLEVKTMGLEKHNDVLGNKIPDYYKTQLEWYLYITKTNTVVFASYRPEDETLHHCEYAANKDFQSKVVIAATRFWELVQTKTPPELSDNDYELVMESEMLSVAVEYKQISCALKDLEKTLESLKTKLIERDRPMLVGGLRVTPYMRKGNVDYSKIEALKHVDLDQYRKAATRVWKIT